MKKNNLFFLIMLIINNVGFSQYSVDLKYLHIDDYLVIDSIRKMPVQIDFKSSNNFPSLMNQYSLGKYYGDTIVLIIDKDSTIFVECRHRSPDFWIFENQFLKGLDSNNIIRIDSFLVESINDSSIFFNCYLKIKRNYGKEEELISNVNILKKQIVGFYVYWPFDTNAGRKNKKRKNKKSTINP